MSTTEHRNDFIAGLRHLAAMLEDDPLLPLPQGSLLAPVKLIEVYGIAQHLGLATDRDDETSKESITLRFIGHVSYTVYGYRDLAAVVERDREIAAKDWAREHGCALTPAQVTV